MKKSEMVEQIAEKAQTSKAAAARVMDAIFDSASGTIAEAVKAGQQVSIPGFGRFKARNRPARKGRNPKTGAEIDIPERTVIAFSPGKGLRDTLAGTAAGKAKKSGGASGSGAKPGSRAGKPGASGGK
jgi:DNA-binding protein HU-beta